MVNRTTLHHWGSVTMFVWLTLWARPAAAAASGDSLLLKITFPVQRDTVTYERIRFAGATDPAASLRINGEAVRVYRHGAFVALLNLQEGDNRIVVKADKKGLSRSDTVSIYRIPLPRPLPAVPAAFDSTSIEPAGEVWTSAEDFLQVSCKGSAGARVQFRLPGLTGWQPMSEERVPEAGGIYRGSIRLPDSTAGKMSQVFFQLRASDSSCAEIFSRGQVKRLSAETPLMAMCRPWTQFYTAPVGGSVLGMLPDSMKLQIIGKGSGRFKVAFGPQQMVYVDETDLRLLAPGTVRRSVAISSPTITVKSDWLVLTFAASEPVPFIADLAPETMTLGVTFFGAYQDGDWTTYPEFPTEIKRVSWCQPAAGTLRIDVVLGQKQSWGYRVSFPPGKIQIQLRRTPRLARDNNAPLSGLRIAIDPGHGGTEPGAISPTGIEEKNINLAISQTLAKWLRSAGADVHLTRNTDTTLTLRQRIEIARKHEAHLFLWIHNNSVGTASDPAISGTSTYFTLAQDQDLAWTVYPHLLRIGLNPFGRIHNSYFVTRTPDMLVLLVEGAFMSNPLDEQKLSDANFQRKIARAIYNGVSEFVRENVN
jgi:N-acetylmuramoyl-L-alanine amidase